MNIVRKFLSLKSILVFKKYILIIFLLFTNIDIKSENNFVKEKNTSAIESENFESLNEELTKYRLGAGDKIFININNIEYLSGIRGVGPDGYLSLPELDRFKVDGLTIESLKEKLDLKYKTFVKEPNSEILMYAYRPVRFYVHGEVKKPGFYSIQLPKSGNSNTIKSNNITNLNSESLSDNITINESSPSLSYAIFPTVFDAIKSSRGITPFSNLSEVTLIRTIPNFKGEKIKYKTSLNFLSMIMEGNQSQNIRILDGDIIFVEKSNIILKKQFAKARKSNLTPDNIIVYISGNVFQPGQRIIPKGSGLNQALAIAGGQRTFSGNIEFLRFNENGETNKSSFRYSSKAKINTKKNPILIEGDIIHVNESLFTKSTKIITTITDPILKTYGLYSLFD